MKSGLFCQKCVNKHGNTSSEGHNSILHDKCCQRTVAFGVLPQDNCANKKKLVVTDANDLIKLVLLLFFFPRKVVGWALDETG